MITYEKRTVETLELEMPIPERITLEFFEQFHAAPAQVYTIGKGKYRIENMEVCREVYNHPLVHGGTKSTVCFVRVYQD